MAAIRHAQPAVGAAGAALSASQNCLARAAGGDCGAVSRALPSPRRIVPTRRGPELWHALLFASRSFGNLRRYSSSARRVSAERPRADRWSRATGSRPFQPVILHAVSRERWLGGRFRRRRRRSADRRQLSRSRNRIIGVVATTGAVGKSCGFIRSSVWRRAKYVALPRMPTPTRIPETYGHTWRPVPAVIDPMPVKAAARRRRAGSAVRRGASRDPRRSAERRVDRRGQEQDLWDSSSTWPPTFLMTRFVPGKRFLEGLPRRPEPRIRRVQQYIERFGHFRVLSFQESPP